MNVFYYDKTFDGLLTAVFDAYKLKMFPERLLTEGDVAPLLMLEMYTSVTNKEKSGRVWKALEKKLSKQALNQMMYVWLSKEPGSDELLFRYICKVVDAPRSIETDFSDGEIMKMFKLAKKVSGERHCIMQFVRFQKAENDVYFAPVGPRYDVLPLVINHFIDRFADQKWIIYDEKRRYGYYYDLKETREMTLDDPDSILNGKLNEKLMAEDEKLFQKLWRGYFKALTIKERINLKQQRRSMPKRFWRYLTELQEQ